MSTVTLDGENGREVILQRLSERDDESIWEFQATLHLPDATATKRVYEHGTELRAFFHELAEGWRGFEGVKTYASLEGEFTIEAEHDGRGTVECCVTLRSPAPPEWSLRAVVEFGPVLTSSDSRATSMRSSRSADVPLGDIGSARRTPNRARLWRPQR